MEQHFVHSYAVEKIETALSLLATTDAPLPDRLRDAWAYEGRLARDELESFPEPWFEKFEAVDREISEMSDDAGMCAEQFVSFALALLQWAGRQHAYRAVGTEKV